MGVTGKRQAQGRERDSAENGQKRTGLGQGKSRAWAEQGRDRERQRQSKVKAG